MCARRDDQRQTGYFTDDPQTAGTNIIQTVDSIRAKLPELQETFRRRLICKLPRITPPPFAPRGRSRANADYLGGAGDSGGVLFLRSGRATIIPAVSVPVSLLVRLRRCTCADSVSITFR